MPERPSEDALSCTEGVLSPPTFSFPLEEQSGRLPLKD